MTLIRRETGLFPVYSRSRSVAKALIFLLSGPIWSADAAAGAACALARALPMTK
jgi:hypothetical protein